MKFSHETSANPRRSNTNHVEVAYNGTCDVTYTTFLFFLLVRSPLSVPGRDTRKPTKMTRNQIYSMKPTSMGKEVNQSIPIWSLEVVIPWCSLLVLDSIVANNQTSQHVIDYTRKREFESACAHKKISLGFDFFCLCCPTTQNTSPSRSAC